MRISKCNLPDGAFLSRYSDTGDYTDCYCVQIDDSVVLADYITAFYTTALFKLERLILAYAVKRPSSDLQARQLALGERDDFAAWTVEQRAADQLLLSDYRGSTRSWLMSVETTPEHTQLYFGSAVVFSNEGTTRGRSWLWPILLALHKVYSRSLLWCAVRRLRGRRSEAI